MSFQSFLQKITQGHDLSTEEARSAFDDIFSGKVSEEQIAGFLTGLHKKGETVDELLGAVTSMRSRAVMIDAPPGTMDIVGTGGDGHGTVNISTAVVLVVAACGVPVAKHGNRAASSRSGSSDILAALGINIECENTVLERCLKEAGICFMHAPRHHPAMKYVAPVRSKLKQRTIFNLIGPLTNPANVRRHLIGVFALEWLGPMAEVLKSLGSEAAWLAHGHDGMDEITTTDETDIVALKSDGLHHFTLAPEQVGLKRAQLGDLKGGDAAQNAALMHKVLGNAAGAYRDIVLFNAAAALVVAGKATDLPQGMQAAAKAIDSGAAKKTLDLLVRLTNERMP